MISPLIRNAIEKLGKQVEILNRFLNADDIYILFFQSVRHKANAFLFGYCGRFFLFKPQQCIKGITSWLNNSQRIDFRKCFENF